MERQDRVSDTISHRIRQNTRRWKLLERQLRPHGRCLSLSPMSPGLRARGTNATWWITTASITMPQLFSDRIRSRIPTSLETPKYSVVAAALVVSTCHGQVHDSTRHSKTTCSCFKSTNHRLGCALRLQVRSFPARFCRRHLQHHLRSHSLRPPSSVNHFPRSFHKTKSIGRFGRLKRWGSLCSATTE